MSEENTGSEEQVVAPEAEVSEAAPAAELFEVHGKKFNISTPEGKGELKGFLEAMSSELGRKNNEVGSLRKFAAAVKPDATEESIIKAARAKAAEGDVDAALDQVFSYSKAKVNELRQAQAVEKENNETWDEYLSSRPDLLKIFDKKTIRSVSESAVGIYDSPDPFKALDAFWMPKVKSLTPAVETKTAPAKTDKPLNTLSGGTASKPSVSSSSSSKDAKTDLFSIFDASTKPFKRA